jgi:RNA 2',3'-cyclic 3'-phosphodiesterase
MPESPATRLARAELRTPRKMSDSTRTFVAIPIPEGLRAKLGRLQAAIAPEAPGTNWVEPNLMHVTLAFLGDVPHSDLADVCRAVAVAVAGYPPISLQLRDLGVFGDPTKPRTAWVGIEGLGVETLANIQKSIATAVAQVGYRLDDDRFQPHVTLGRIKSGRGRSPDFRPLLKKHAGWVGSAFEVKEIVTFGSTLGPDGPSYDALARAPLGGKKN